MKDGDIDEQEDTERGEGWTWALYIIVAVFFIGLAIGAAVF